jgi:ferritin-like metal-binding protein YciE
MKFFNEEKAKRFKALTCLHNAASEEIFTRIMACKSAKETWDKLKAEFHGDEKSRKMQVLNLRRQFEGLKMKETETIKDFSSQISKLVNQVRLLGEDFPDSRIVEKVLVSLPEKFEHKICSLEDSKDFSEMSLEELINALQAVE